MKAGYDTARSVNDVIKPDSVDQDRESLLANIRNEYRSERMHGIDLLWKYAHKQEIISHPTYIDIYEIISLERLFLAKVFKY